MYGKGLWMWRVYMMLVARLWFWWYVGKVWATYDTDARDSIFPFSGLSQHDIGLVLG